MTRGLRSIAWLALAVVAGAAMSAGPASAKRAPRTYHATASISGGQNQRFHATMDRVFGPGRWRETSGYRSPAEEDRLRREGAGTVPEGRFSAHSMGTPDAPGAYDAVVYGMRLGRAAELLREQGEGFSRVFAEGAHGPEGAHLHIEVGGFLRPEMPLGVVSLPTHHLRPIRVASACDSIYLRVAGGRRNSALAAC